ncbi:MAG TPA: hypothetical protein VEF33_07120, partial [Syntrophales bacterium]|nr:hypothetical protein [Syntrophales bacterium]
KELVRNVHFSIGEIPSALREKSNPELFSPETYPLKDKEKKLIEKSTSSIADKELKEILKRVMTKNIIRRRFSGTRKPP